MSSYFCSFCSSRYQFHTTRTDGVMICGQCGEELIKAPLVKMTQVIGLFVASFFLVPLLMMVVFIVDDLNNLRINNSSEHLTFLSLDLDDE